MDARQVDRLVTFREAFGDRKRGVPGIIPMSRSQVYEKIKEGLLPRPLHLANGRGSYWKLSSLQEVIDKAAA